MSEYMIDGYDFGEMEAQKYYAPPSSWSDEKIKQTANERIFSGDFIASEKLDGFFGCFVKSSDGKMMLKTRSRGVDGTFANKLAWVPQLQGFFDILPNGTCLLGELFLPSSLGSKNTQSVLGCLRDKAIQRQEKSEYINYYIFDCLAWSGKNLINKPIIDRVKYIDAIAGDIKYIKFAKYYSGADIWNQLQEILADGREGMVLVHKNEKYQPGKRPSKETLKLKQSLKQTIDAVIIGANAPTRLYSGKDINNWPYWMEAETNNHLPEGSHYQDYRSGARIEAVTKPYYKNWAGSLQLGLYENGKLVHFGDVSGLTDDMKENWRMYVGRVVEIGGMEVFDDTTGHGIRHPKLLQVRAIGDKQASDCTMDQLK